MYCSNCGKEIDEKAAACPYCGVATKNISAINDTGGIGWGILGGCFPVIGLILYLVWKDDKPKSSKAAGIGALVGGGITVGLLILYFVFIFSLLGSVMWNY